MARVISKLDVCRYGSIHVSGENNGHVLEDVSVDRNAMK